VDDEIREALAAGSSRRWSRPHWLIAALVAALTIAGSVIAIVALTAGNSQASSGTDNSAASVSLQSVARRTLSSQTQVDATLGYAGSYTVVVPGTGGASTGSAASPRAGQAVGTLTALPNLGATLSQGHAIYSIDGCPVIFLHGSTPAYRSLADGASGADVRQLNADLVRLGYATAAELDPASDYFGAASADALEKLQAALDLPETGTLPLDQAVFLPARALRVSAVSATLGTPAQPGSPVLQASSTVRQVVVDLDAAQQSDVKVGDRVTITMPDNSTTPGRVTSVGTVATTPASSSAEGGSPSSSNSGATPTIEVDIAPTHPAATGRLDQAPVEVTITTATVANALVVPVDSLLAQAGGGYAVEVISASGAHRLVPVSLGLFDDADGLVQVSGAGLAAGQNVVVPGS
jgi:hypothetical protein